MTFFQDYTELKQKIIDTIQSLSNVKVDDSKYSFISQFVNAIAVADDNILFYISLLLNESNINSAILPETIVQMAKVLGVDVAQPRPATSTVELKIQITPNVTSEFIFDESFVIASTLDSKVKFLLQTTYRVVYDSISRKSYVYDAETNYPISSYIIYDDTTQEYFIVCNVDIIQIEKETITVTTTDTIQYFDVEKDKEKFDYDYKIFVNGIEYSEVKSIYQLVDNTFTINQYTDINRIYFATDFSGKAIQPDSEILISRYFTLGVLGNVAANSLVVQNNIVDLKTKLPPNIIITNSDIANGANPDDLVEYKEKIFTTFLNKNTILSKEYDMQNIQAFIPDVKYPKSVIRRSISPEFTTFVELTVNGDIINTNSITLKGVTNFKVNQNNILYKLRENNSYLYSESSDANYSTTIEINSAVCPFELKYSNDFKYVEYFYIHNILNIPFAEVASIISTVDNTTSVKIQDILMEYDQDTGDLNFKSIVDLNTPDINVIYDSSKFNVYVSLIDTSCDSTVSEYRNIDNTAKLSVNEDTGLIYLTFKDNISNISPEIKYQFYVKITYYDEVITTQQSQNLEYYTKMNITSAVKINDARKIYESDVTYDNSPSYSINGSDNLTPYLLYTKGILTFTPNSIKVHIYKTSQNVATYDLSQITKISALVNGISYTLTPDYATSETLDFTIPIDIDLESDQFTISFILTDTETYIQYKYHLIDLSAVELSLDYDIYHVPIIRYSDYMTIIKPNVPESPYLRIQSVYDELDDKIILGTSQNIKFIKTFGRILNIKYNSSFTYSPEYIDVITIPLQMQIDVIISQSFNPNIDAAKIVNIIKDYQNTNAAIESNIKSSEIESIVIEQVKSIYSINITQPPFDIIYDIKPNAITKNYNEYVPELIRIESIKLNYISNYSQS